MGRQRPTKNLTLSQEVKMYLDQHENASRLVDDLVSEHMDEIEEQQNDLSPDLMKSLESIDKLDAENRRPDRASVKYAAKSADVSPEKLLEIYRENA